MKRTTSRALCMLLIFCVCVSLAACGSRNVGGIGSLTMDDKNAGGVGVLGGGTGEEESSSEPTQTSPSAPEAPTDEYAVFSSEQQNFSFLYDKSYTGEWSEENGATIYTQTADSIPYLLVYRNSYGDTTGFDIQEYFDVQVETMREEYGSRLLSVSEAQTLTVGDKKIPGVIFTYTVDSYTIEMFLLLEDNGESLIQYTCKYIQGEGESTLQALARAVATYQPDADYYADGGSGPDAPTAPIPQATQAPADASAFETEMYECDMFTVMIPKDWTVDYDVVDVGNDMERIYLFVRDPANLNNMFFYILAMEPFFLSAEGKDAWLPYMPDYFQYAPVLTDPTAEEILRIWPSIYTFMQAENGPLLPFFSNYALSEVMESGLLESNSDSAQDSYALGKVEIPSAGQYYMFFQSSLQLMDAPAGIDSSAKYYTSYGNFGIVLSTDAPASDLDALKVCLESLNLDGFANRQ